MQTLDLALAFDRLAHATVEGARCLVLQLLLPRVNLVGMNLVALCQVGDRRLVLFVIVCSVSYGTALFSNYHSGPKNWVHFIEPLLRLDCFISKLGNLREARS